jgi:type II secretory pathway component PulC
MRAAEAKAAFLILLLWTIVVLRATVPALAQDQPAATPANPVAGQALDKLSTTLDRPLFSPSRHPPAPPPPPVAQAPPPPPPPQPPPNLVLFGVVMDGEGARAVVRAGADRKLLRAQIGDDIEGWKVSQIEGRKVVLSLDGRFATFTMFSDDRAKSDAAGTAAPGSEPSNSQRQIQAQQAPPQPTAPQSGQPRKRRRTRE